MGVNWRQGILNIKLSQHLSEIWIDRDLSWLDFNDWVLAQALDDRTPLLERAKFLAIFTSNLDEFFMKRMAVLRHANSEFGSGLLQRLRNKLVAQLCLQADCYRQNIIPGLAKHGIVLARWNELTLGQQEEASAYFESNLSPALTPLVIDPDHPFPFLSNLSSSLTFRLHEPGRSEFMYARVKVPGELKQWVFLTTDVASGHKLLVQLCEIVRGNLDKLYCGMAITATTVVRLTRDAEVEIDDDPRAGVRELVEEQVRQRRYEPVVRLEFGPGADTAVKEMLRERFELSRGKSLTCQERLTTRICLSLRPCRSLNCATRPGPLLRIRSFRMKGQQFSAPSRQATFLFIIPTIASTPVSNTSLAQPLMIRPRFQSR